MDDPNELQQRLIELVYGLLDEEEAAQLRHRIATEEHVARAMAEAERLALVWKKAARVEAPPIPLVRPVEGPVVRQDSTAARSGDASSTRPQGAAPREGSDPFAPERTAATQPASRPASHPAARAASTRPPSAATARASWRRWSQWTVSLSAAALLIVSLGGYTYYRGELSELTAQHVRLRVTGPSELQLDGPNRFDIATTDLSGKPLPTEVQLTLVAQDGRSLVSQRESTDERGRLAISLPRDLKADSAVKLQLVASNKSLSERFETSLPAAPEPQVACVAGDRPAYAPGETVRARVLALSAVDRRVEREGNVRFSLLDSKGNEAAGPTAPQPTAHGAAAAELALPTTAAPGDYTLVATSAEGKFAPAQTAVAVRSPAPPPLVADVELLRDNYAPGSKVVAHLAASRPDGSPAAGATFQAVAHVDGKDAYRAAGKVSAEGTHQIAFDLPRQIARSDARLTVTLDDAGRTVATTRRVPIEQAKVSLAFFPEGGGLVAGLPNRVYFTARGPQGEPVSIAGLVVDSQGRAVAALETARDGMGAFILEPNAEQTYRVRLEKPPGIAQTPSLPVAQAGQVGQGGQGGQGSQGASLNAGVAVYEPGKPIECSVRTTEENVPLLAAVNCDGVLVGQQAFVGHRKPAAVVVPIDEDAAGVLRLELFDCRNNPPKPIASRLVFRRPSRRLNVQLSPPELLAGGQQTQMRLAVSDEQNRPVAATLGVSVVRERRHLFDDASFANGAADANALARASANPPLTAQLLLAGATASPIELRRAAEYLAADPQAAQALDLFLGTRPAPRSADRFASTAAARGELAAAGDVAAVAGRANAARDDVASASAARARAPLVFDNLGELQERYRASIAAWNEHRARVLNVVIAVSLFGAIALVVYLALLTLMNIPTGARLWTPSLGVATVCLLLGVFLLNPSGQRAGTDAPIAFGGKPPAETTGDTDEKHVEKQAEKQADKAPGETALESLDLSQGGEAKRERFLEAHEPGGNRSEPRRKAAFGTSMPAEQPAETADRPSSGAVDAAPKPSSVDADLSARPLPMMKSPAPPSPAQPRSPRPESAVKELEVKAGASGNAPAAAATMPAEPPPSPATQKAPDRFKAKADSAAPPFDTPAASAPGKPAAESAARAAAKSAAGAGFGGGMGRSAPNGAAESERPAAPAAPAPPAADAPSPPAAPTAAPASSPRPDEMKAKADPAAALGGMPGPGGPTRSSGVRGGAAMKSADSHDSQGGMGGYGAIVGKSGRGGNESMPGMTSPAESSLAKKKEEKPSTAKLNEKDQEKDDNQHALPLGTQQRAAKRAMSAAGSKPALPPGVAGAMSPGPDAANPITSVQTYPKKAAVDDLKRADDSKSRAVSQSPAVPLLEERLYYDAEKGKRIEFAWGRALGEFPPPLYWNAALSTDAAGNGVVKFPAAAGDVAYRVCVDAHTADGRLGHATHVWSFNPPTTLAAAQPASQAPGAAPSGEPVLRDGAAGISMARTRQNAEEQSLRRSAGRQSDNFAFENEPRRRLWSDLASSEYRRLEVLRQSTRERAYDQVDAEARKEPASRYKLAVDKSAADKLTADGAAPVARTASSQLGYPRWQATGGRLDASADITWDVPADVLPGTLRAEIVFEPSPTSTALRALDALCGEADDSFESAAARLQLASLALSGMVEREAAQPALVRRLKAVLSEAYAAALSRECPEQGFQWFGKQRGDATLTSLGLGALGQAANWLDVDPMLAQRNVRWLARSVDPQAVAARPADSSKASSAVVSSKSSARPSRRANAVEPAAVEKPFDTSAEWQRLASRLVAATGNEADSVRLGLAALAALETDRQADARDLLRRLAALQSDDGSLRGEAGLFARPGSESACIERTALALAVWSRLPEFTGSARRAAAWLMAHRSPSGQFGPPIATALAVRGWMQLEKPPADVSAGQTLSLARGNATVDSRAIPADRLAPLVFDIPASQLAAGKDKFTLRTDGAAGAYQAVLFWQTAAAPSDPRCPLRLTTSLSDTKVRPGQTVDLAVELSNSSAQSLPAVAAQIALPWGLELAPDQAERLQSLGTVDAVGQRDGLVWFARQSLEPNQRLSWRLPLRVAPTQPGKQLAAPSSAWLYDTPDQRQWTAPLAIEIVR